MFPKLVLDIETCPIDRAADYIEEPSAPANYKNPEAIASYIATAKQAAVDKCGLDPDLGRIVALGWMLEGQEEPTVRTCRAEVDEAQALKELWRLVEMPSGAHRVLVTFNGNGFDLPFLMRRSLYLGMVYPHLNIDRYRTNHLDLLAKLTYNGLLKAHSLKFYAKRFCLPVEDETKGADIPALVRDGSDTAWQAIHDHCRADVLTTYLLASRLQLIDFDPRALPREAELTA
jgi:uncharacterized protein YprB with RNaseH-like and TPR domain